MLYKNVFISFVYVAIKLLFCAQGFPSVSSLFRWHPKNLRSLILAAGRRELPGFDAEKKRLVQVSH